MCTVMLGLLHLSQHVLFVNFYSILDFNSLEQQYDIQCFFSLQERVAR